jgi:hypothetical protein
MQLAVEWQQQPLNSKNRKLKLLLTSSAASGLEEDDDMCPICLEPFSKAGLEFLAPKTCFVPNMPELDMATLEDCGHRFCPLAIAFHMLVSGMECPVCRHGDKSCLLDISCIPEHVRSDFEKASACLQTNHLSHTNDHGQTASHVSMVRNMLAMVRQGRNSSTRRGPFTMHLLVYLYAVPPANQGRVPMQVSTLEFVLMHAGNNTYMLMQPQVSSLLAFFSMLCLLSFEFFPCF